LAGEWSPPSTYGRPRIQAGLKKPGIEQEAATASARFATGEPGRPNATRRPVR